MASTFLLRIYIDGEFIDSLHELISAKVGGEIKTSLRNTSPSARRYWRSSYFLTDLDRLSDDVVKLVNYVPKQVAETFGARISVTFIERYDDDVRHGHYLSTEALKTLAAYGADFDYDLSERGGFESGNLGFVP